jgi:hypothetical protein
VGCIDWIEKGCSTCAARKNAWAGVLIQITTISITRIKSFNTLLCTCNNQGAHLRSSFCDIWGISNLITSIPSLSYLNVHYTVYFMLINCYLRNGRLWQSGLIPLHPLRLRRLGARVSHLPLFERWRIKFLIEYEALSFIAGRSGNVAQCEQPHTLGQQVE